MTEYTAGQENVLKFRSFVESDPALQAEVETNVGNGTWNAAGIVEIARSRSLDFSVDDIEAAMDQHDELSDFELELVAAAGGATCVDNGL